MKCNHCNAEVENGTKFCHNCGSPIEGLSQSKATCSQCGGELEVGEKFCSNCGTPVGEVQQPSIQHEIEQSVTPSSEQEVIKDRTTTRENAATPKETERKANRLGRVAMWSTIVAIVMCFVVTGFGFSFWWYLFILFMAALAFVLFVTVSGPMNENDISLAKVGSIACFVCIGLLWKCGPLNSDYASDREVVQSSEDEAIPSWIFGKWYLKLDGGRMVVIINKDGSARMELRKHWGDTVVLSYDGKFFVSGDYLYLSLNGMSSNPQLIMDREEHKLYSAEGNAYRKSY